MDLDLRGKHAVVGGGSAGIGLASAIELAKLGARVTLLARREAPLQAALAQLSREAGQAHAAVSLDLGDSAALQRLTTEQIDPAGIDVLVNNSGGPPGGAIVDASEEAFLAALRPHLLASHRLVQAVLPGMRARRWGRIVNVVSTSVYEPIPGLGVSNTLRAAVAGWAKTLSREIAGHGITVNNVLPGYTRTDRIAQIVADRVASSGRSAADVEAAMLASVPAARMADAHEVAAAVAFLASPAAGYITGVSLAVDGGRMQSI